MQTHPVILTIAGSDSGGGAGIQADLKTIMALCGYGVSAITALTAQNGLQVDGIQATPAEFVLQQLQTIAQGFPIACAKTGMLFRSDIISTVAHWLQTQSFPVIVDPVCASQSGFRLMEDEAIETLRNNLLPVATLLTPNVPEAEILAGQSIHSEDDIFKAGTTLLSLCKGAVLIKGGHMENQILAKDYFFMHETEPKIFSQPHVDTYNNHGTGCTLSAAIATYLGRKFPLEVAIKKAQEYLNGALRKSYTPGKGAGPVNHAWLVHN